MLHDKRPNASNIVAIITSLIAAATSLAGVYMTVTSTQNIKIEMQSSSIDYDAQISSLTEELENMIKQMPNTSDNVDDGEMATYNFTSGYLGTSVKAYRLEKAKEYPDTGTFVMAGVTYRNGITSSHSETGHALYNLNGNYSILSGLYGPMDNTTANSYCTINFYGDNVFIDSLDCDYGDMPKEFSLPLEGVNQLKIEFTIPSNLGSFNFCLANAVFE